MSNDDDETNPKSRVGVFGMGVMGQNLALNIASKKFPVSCYNREDEFSSRLFEALEIAKKELFGDEGEDERLLRAFTDLKEFVESLQKPR